MDDSGYVLFPNGMLAPLQSSTLDKTKRSHGWIFFGIDEAFRRTKMEVDDQERSWL